MPIKDTEEAKKGKAVEAKIEGNKDFRAKNYEKALELYNIAIELDPEKVMELYGIFLNSFS